MSTVSVSSGSKPKSSTSNEPVSRRRTKASASGAAQARERVLIAPGGQDTDMQAFRKSLRQSKGHREVGDDLVGPGGGGGSESYIARDPSSQRAVLVKPNGDVLDIHDGRTFNCLAATWLVRDYPTQWALNAVPSRLPRCSDAGPRTWDFRPIAQGGNVPVNVLFRERFEDATNGRVASWLINSRGEIQSIPDGGTYECLAYTNPVVWNVPFSVVQKWVPVGTSNASCG